MIPRRTREWAVMALAVLVGAVTTSCSTAKHPNPPPSPNVLRGSSLSAAVCPAPTPPGSPMTMRADEVTVILLCPLPSENPSPTRGAPTTVSASNPAFAGLLAALATPDIEAKGERIACPTYADIPQTVEAQSPAAVMVVHIPIDECGHYQSGPLFALMRARFGFTQVGLGDNGHTITLRRGQILDIKLPPPPVSKGWQPPQVSVPTVLLVLAHHAPAVGAFSATLRAQDPGRTQVVVSYRCPRGACNGWGILVEVTG